jgi:hypothetical protein
MDKEGESGFMRGVSDRRLGYAPNLLKCGFFDTPIGVSEQEAIGWVQDYIAGYEAQAKTEQSLVDEIARERNK